MIGSVQAIKKGPGWVVWDAEERLERFRLEEKTAFVDRFRREWSKTQLPFQIAFVFFSVFDLQAFTLLISKWSLGQWQGPAASGTGSYQIDLWMVAATIIGVSLPVFVVIVQFAESASDEVVVLPIAEVLRRESRVNLAILWSGVVVVHCGFDAIWIRSQTVLDVDFFLAFIPLVILLGSSYFRLFRLVSARADLKERSYQMLAMKFYDAIDESWVNEEANRKLRIAFAQENVPFTLLLPPAISDAWIVVGPAEDGKLIDIEPLSVVAILGLTQPNESNLEETVQFDSQGTTEPGAFLLQLCGGPLGPTHPLIAVRKVENESRTGPDLWSEIQAHVEIEATNG